MTLSKRTALGISLGVIVAHWIYQLVSHQGSQPLPEHFSELVLRIVRNKLIVFAALFLLLRLQGEGWDGLGVSRHNWPKHLGVGLAIGFAMFVGLNVALDSMMNSLIPRPPTSGPSIMAFFKDPGNLAHGASWIPAFEALTVARYDAWAFEWAEALTRTRPERCERRFFLEEPVDKANRVVPCAIAWDAVRPLFPRLLLELLPKPVQARLNPMIVKKIFAATIDVSTVSLVFVPAPVMKDGERRVVGPSSSVGWVPLRDGRWPPDLQRDVRRALERGKRMDEPRENRERVIGR